MPDTNAEYVPTANPWVDVPVPAGSLWALISYALAGPTNEASRRNRDAAVAEVERCIEATARQRHIDGSGATDA